ncbi:hypothetical protein C0992_009119, partial [Termitomyces sp. T32_za158]
EPCTPSQLAEHQDKIWAAICSLDADVFKITEPPFFEASEPWHSIVIHRVPVLGRKLEDTQVIGSELAKWNGIPDLDVSDIKKVKILCRKEEIKTAEEVSVKGLKVHAQEEPASCSKDVDDITNQATQEGEARSYTPREVKTPRTNRNKPKNPLVQS